MSSRILTSLLVLAGLLLAPMTATAGPSTATRSASVSTRMTNGLAVIKTKDLDFGSIIPGAAAGTVTVSPANVRAFTGPLVFGNGVTSNASINVTHPGGTYGSTYGVVLPGSININSGASSMVIDNFIWTDTWLNFFPPFLVRLDVGATLHVGAAQPVGTYSGTFNITITEQ
jgi:Domain of unknown function (DUF4402)